MAQSQPTPIHFTRPSPRTRREFQDTLIAEAWLTLKGGEQFSRKHHYLRVERPTPQLPIDTTGCSTSCVTDWRDPEPKIHWPARIVGIMVFGTEDGRYNISLSTARQNEDPFNGERYLTKEQLRVVHTALWNYYKTLNDDERMCTLGRRVYAVCHQIFKEVTGNNDDN